MRREVSKHTKERTRTYKYRSITFKNNINIIYERSRFFSIVFREFTFSIDVHIALFSIQGMNSRGNDCILAEKKLNMLTNLEKTSSCHTSITFSQTSERKLSLMKTYSCIEANSSHHSNDTNLLITAKQFADLFERKSSSLPIVDCRSQIDYACERIRSSHNINCRAKLLAKKLISKRLDEIEPNLSNLIEHSDRIILYDQSTDVRDEEKVRSLPINLVLQAAKRSNKKVFIIQGKRQKSWRPDGVLSMSIF